MYNYFKDYMITMHNTEHTRVLMCKVIGTLAIHNSFFQFATLWSFEKIVRKCVMLLFCSLPNDLSNLRFFGGGQANLGRGTVLYQMDLYESSFYWMEETSIPFVVFCCCCWFTTFGPPLGVPLGMEEWSQSFSVLLLCRTSGACYHGADSWKERAVLVVITRET